MEIIGIGIDLQEIKTFEEHLHANNDRFFSRIFTESEIAYCQNKSKPAQHFTARFCAKEAAVKAISSLGDAIVTQFEVVSKNGKPSLVVHRTENESSNFLDGCQFMVTLSHTDNYAVAQVLAYLESK